MNTRLRLKDIAFLDFVAEPLRLKQVLDHGRETPPPNRAQFDVIEVVCCDRCSSRRIKYCGMTYTRRGGNRLITAKYYTCDNCRAYVQQLIEPRKVKRGKV